MAAEKRKLVARCLEILLVGTIIIAVWLAMFLPVVVYFLPLNRAQTSSVDEDGQHNTTSVELVSCQNPLSTMNSDDSKSSVSPLVCREDFFLDPADGSVCKPNCNSWTMFSQQIKTVSQVIIGISTVIGVLTTGVIVVLSFTCFRNMLVFPSVLILYQDILVSIHGVNILIGFGNRQLFCTSDDLIEAYRSSASPYCTISGLVSGQIVLPLTVWIAIQVGYILLAVLFPFFFKRLTANKRRGHILHIISLLAGLLSLVIPSVLIQTLSGYGLIDTLFPPIVCFPTNRDINAYTVLIPLGVLMAMIITFLVFILHHLIRNRCINKTSNKNLKTAEIKVFIICCCYIILGLGASLAYSISSTFVDNLQSELLDYFECERCGVNSGQSCDRSGFERLTNPPLITLGYSLFVLYPVITLIYVVRINKKPQCHANHALPRVASKLTSLTSN